MFDLLRKFKIIVSQETIIGNEMRMARLHRGRSVEPLSQTDRVSHKCVPDLIAADKTTLSHRTPFSI